MTRRHLGSVQVLTLGYVGIAVVGALLLSLPLSSERREAQSLLDALFTATSALTTTGLIVVDTGGYYSTLGEVVVLALMQIGGIGYMVIVAWLATIVGQSLALRPSEMLEQSIAGISRRDWRHMVRVVLTITIVTEALGALGFTMLFAERYGLGRAAYLAIFHTVSTFCTAGFSLFEDSFIGYVGDVRMLLVIAIVSNVGAIGFFVVADVWRYGRKVIEGEFPRRLTTHSHVALSVSALSMGIGILFLIVSESGLGTWTGQVMPAAFQSISAATTTGYNSIDVGAMSRAGLLLLVLQMYIGASPGSTGGGIKTTTFGVTMVSLWTVVRGRENATIASRGIPAPTRSRALHICVMAAGGLLLGTLLMCLTEPFTLEQILFEAASALGTVGLSTGITSGLSAVGKAVIIAMMLVGRVGVLAMGLSLVRQTPDPHYRDIADDLFLG